MKTFRCLGVAAALAGSAVFSAPSFAAMDFTGIGYVQYGDAQSYSLPIASLQDGCTGPGCDFYVNSAPGAIKGLTVLGTGANGKDLLTNFSGMDNAYSTPTGVVTSNPYWAPSPTSYNGTLGTVNNNGADTWDSNLLAMKTYLAGEQMIFFFNNNQTKSLGTAAESLAAWAHIMVKDTAGTVIAAFDLVNKSTTGGIPGPYNLTPNSGGTFNGNVGAYQAVVGPTNPFAGTKDSTDYVLSGGAVCVIMVGPLPVPVDCATPGASKPIDHNLGANQAAYAILFPELNTFLSGLFGLGDAVLETYTLSVDVRLGCDPSFGPNGPELQVCTGVNGEPIEYGRNLNNGYEQIFISKASDVVHIPEPGTLALAGLVLVGMAFMRRRT